ncbi:MATE family efflux transporter [Paenibacillus cremeus]|uniref:Probable multidrug resistance protein NorM n=2 Tax=Paenibacillus cremeus TaxID=2163881 RepID=A0A559K996_9BACL|nr:MATE family efflux transporter [Paenibacillus cremeus]TVY08697.1 MATE family efflux transporter [Paenibacillus cremeus]
MQAFLEKYFSGESIDYRQIFGLFFPILIDQAFLVCLSLVNTAMISSSGVAAVSAVSTVDSINMFLISVFVAIATGGTVVVAQYKGSGNTEMVDKAAASSVSAVTLFSVCVSLLVVLFSRPLLSLLFGAAEADVLDNAGIYLIGSGVSFVGIAIKEAVCGALRGIGKTRVTLMLSLVMNLSYLLLNVVFINWMHMGVHGMVFSVNISRYLAAACAIFYLVRMDTSLHYRIRDAVMINFSMFKRILFIGLPFAAEQLFFNGGKILTQTFVVSLGTYAIAVNAIGSSIAVVYQIAPIALSTTTVTVIGQCIGRRNIQDARKLTKSFLWLSSCSFIVMAIIMMPLFHPLLGLFHPPTEIVDDIYWLVLINAIALIPLWSISFLLPAALRAAGDSKFVSVTAMLTMWLFRVVMGYVFGILLHWGVIGVWLAMELEWGVRGAVFLWRFRGEQWYKHRLIEPGT